MSTINLITPTEARDRVASSVDQFTNNALFEIDRIIRHESDNGKFTTLFDLRNVSLSDSQQPIVDEIKNKLTTDGYTVTVNRQYKFGSEVFEVIHIDWNVV